MQSVDLHGTAIPALGLGIFRMSDAEVTQIVAPALEAGFRHFDTAQIYGNEAALGQALKAAGARREDLFLTTKVWVDNYSDAAFAASVDESLDKLGVDRVDLLLAHWPGTVPVADQLEWLRDVQAAGKTRLIGVSNYNGPQFAEAIAAGAVTNQVEMHPYLDQSALIAQAKSGGSALTAYFGMADGAVPKDDRLIAIGARHGKTAAQVALRWILQQGVIALSKTAKPERLAENIAVFDFELTAAEMAEITAMAKPDGRIVSPPGLAPDWAA